MVGQRDRKVKSFLEGSRCDALNSRLETRLAHHEPLRDTMKVATERTILVHVGLPGRWSDPKNPFGEIAALVEAAGAEVVGTISQKLSKPSAKTLIRKGKVQELAAAVKALSAGLVVFDHDLTPAQIRELEKACVVKILDRSELILDIFASRAATLEAKLQVEIAQLQYTYPRLRAMWDHLGQVTGGAPVGIGTRGPGKPSSRLTGAWPEIAWLNCDESWPKCNAERVAKWPIEPKITSRWAWWVTPTRGKARSSIDSPTVARLPPTCCLPPCPLGSTLGLWGWCASLGL